MTNYDKAKQNYERGLWTKEMIKTLVAKNKLSAEDFKKITGEDYATE